MTAQLEHERNMLRGDRSQMVAELDAAGAKWHSNGKDCCCPWHDDANPSAGIFQSDGDNVWRFKCFPCGFKAMDIFDVRARRLGKPVEDVMREWAAEQKPAPKSDRSNLRVYESRDALTAAATYAGDRPRHTVEAVYNYTPPGASSPELIVYRLRQDDGKKTFRQASPVPCGWILRGPAGLWPLYNRTRVAGADVVVVVEGEKCVHALTEHLPAGCAATTNPGGGERGKVALCDWTPLAGKRCFLWPDNDPPDAKRDGARTGIEHMKAVAEALGRLNPPAEVNWIDPDGLDLPPHGDAADWIERATKADGRVFDRLEMEVLAKASPLRASAPLQRHYAAIASGKLYATPWPWPLLTKATQALVPGTVTMLCGEPGAGKSFFLVECLWAWLSAGERAGCLMMESGATFHAQRLHAQLADEPGLLSMDWVKANGDKAESLYRRHAAELDMFWACTSPVADDEVLTPVSVLDWVRTRFRAGARVVALDPITAIAGERPWVTDREFLQPARRLCTEFQASLVLATHPDRGGKKLAGSEAMRRFVDTVFWLIRHDKPRNGRVVYDRGYVSQQTWNRTIRITKARLAAGAGMELAYKFGDGLRFSEIGIVAADATEADE